MSETKQQEATTDTPVVPETATPKVAVATDAPAAAQGDAKRAPQRRQAGGDNRRNNARRPRRGGRQERVRPEFDQKIVSIRRVTRVMAGGRRFSFSVSMIIGDKKGKVGVGIGKAGDTQLAIEKSVRNAKKHMIVIPMDKDGRAHV